VFWRKKKPEVTITKFDSSSLRMGIDMEGKFTLIYPTGERRKDGTIFAHSISCSIQEAEAIAQCALQAIREEKKIRANPH